MALVFDIEGARLNRRLTGTVFCLCLGVLFAVVVPAIAQDNRKPLFNTDWIFVVDTSKSMRGATARGENVFSQVKEQIKKFIRTASDGDTIAIYTFAEKPDLIRNVQIKTSLDREELINSVESMAAEGNWTYTGDAVDRALERSQILRSQYDDINRETAIVLFTDDKEDHDPKKPSKFLSDIPVSKEQYRPFIFVIHLNKKAPPKELEDFVKKFEDRGHLIVQPEQLTNLPDIIYSLLPPIVAISPTSLLFGQIEPGQRTDIKEIAIITRRRTSVKIYLEDVEADKVILAEPPDTVMLQSGDNLVETRLEARSVDPDSTITGKLVIKVDEITPQVGGNRADGVSTQEEMIDFSFKVVRCSVWCVIKPGVIWLSIFLATVVVSWVIFYGITGKHPPEFAHDHFHLEGEFLITKPALEGVNNAISLNSENRSKVRLSSLQGGILKQHLTVSDAYLRTVHRNGEKLVNISCIEGNLYVREREITSADLYDGDEIEIDDLKLIYRGRYQRIEEFE